MNTINKIFSIALMIISSINYAANEPRSKFNDRFKTEFNTRPAKKNNYTSQDKYIGLQFAPLDEKAPYSQEEFDQLVAGLLDKIIKLDIEIHNNPRLKSTPSIHDFVVEENSNHLLISKNKSFGWNDPIAIMTALFYNGTAETPNEFIQIIQESAEFPGLYKASLKATGLYNTGDKSAHSELATYIKQVPAKISKYKKLEDITTLQELNDEENSRFKDSEKIKLKQNLPSLQGEIQCDCYAHGCDVKGVVYFNSHVLRYLIQKHNGSRHLNNNTSQSIQKITLDTTPHKKNDLTIDSVNKEIQENKTHDYDVNDDHCYLDEKPSDIICKEKEVTFHTNSHKKNNLTVNPAEKENKNDNNLIDNDSAHLDTKDSDKDHM